MIKTIKHEDNIYPFFQSTGNAAKFCMAFALEVVKGDVIYDIGYGKDEWKFPTAVGIDLKDCNEYDAMHLPDAKADAIFSSHLLEHLERPYEALDIWHEKLKSGGVLFMYLPNMDTQSYHRCWSNRNHLHYVSPYIMRLYFEDKRNKWCNIFISERDAYDSFTVFCNKVIV
jgi:predicted SAM-dependent methyltransferase